MTDEFTNLILKKVKCLKKFSYKMENYKKAIDFNCSLKPYFEKIKEPLKNLSIEQFTYQKVLKNGRIITTSSKQDIAPLLPIFSEGPTFPKPFLEAQKHQKYKFIWPEGKNPIFEKLGVNIWNGLSFYIDREYFIEAWIFSTEKYYDQANELYLNNLEFLEKYINHHRFEIDSLVSKADNMCFINTKVPLIEKDNSLKNRISLNKNRYYLNYKGISFYLTKQEYKCLIYMAKGFCIKEISDQLEISNRTIEKHFQNIKEKTNILYLSDIRKLSSYIYNYFEFE